MVICGEKKGFVLRNKGLVGNAVIRPLLAVGLGLALVACTVQQTAQPPATPPQAVSAVQPQPAPQAPHNPGAFAVAQRAAQTPALQASATAAAPMIDEFYPSIGGKRAKSALKRNLGKGDISLEFQRAEITEIVSVILGDLLGVPFTIDPDVRGTASLRTGEPISAAGLVPVLEAVLASANAVLVNQGGVYRVSLADAQSFSGGAVGANMPGANGGGFEVFPLSYIGAAELAKIIKPLLPEGRPLTVDETRNILIVAGSGPELRTVRDTIAVFDVDHMAEKAVLLTSLEHVDVETILLELENIFGDTGKGPLAGLVRFVPIERLNAVMVISTQQAYLQEARDWIARLDRTRRSDERRIFVYFMQHGSASNMVTTLRDIFGAARGDKADDGASLNVETEAGESADGPAPRVTAEQSKNALLIHASEQQYRQILEVLSTLDVEPLQVMIEAQIVEVSLSDTLRYGVQYFLDTGGFGNATDSITQLTTGISPTSISPNLGAATPPSGGFAFTVQGGLNQSRVILDALSDLTTVNMVSAPTVFVLDNQVARLSVGDEVPIITQTSEGLTDDARTVNTVQYRSTGVLLEVTPRVNSGGMVTLEIVQEVSAAVNTQASGTSTIDSPTIQQRSFLSTVAVHDGETVLLGGLIRETGTKGKSGIPGLHTVPVLGHLFGRTSETAQRTELMVMITPTVVRNVQENRDATYEIGRKFQGVLRVQQEGAAHPRQEFSE